MEEILNMIKNQNMTKEDHIKQHKAQIEDAKDKISAGEWYIKKQDNKIARLELEIDRHQHSKIITKRRLIELREWLIGAEKHLEEVENRNEIEDIEATGDMQ